MPRLTLIVYVRPPSVISIEMFKTKDPRATRRLNWQCPRCPFFGVSCHPGEAEQSIEPDALGPLREFAETEAERRWAAGEKRVVITVDESGATSPDLEEEEVSG